MLLFLSTHPHTKTNHPLTIRECLEKHILAVSSVPGHSAGPDLDHVASPWPQTLQNNAGCFALHNWAVQQCLGLKQRWCMRQINGSHRSKSDCTYNTILWYFPSQRQWETTFSAEYWPMSKGRLIQPQSMRDIRTDNLAGWCTFQRICISNQLNSLKSRINNHIISISSALINVPLCLGGWGGWNSTNFST